MKLGSFSSLAFAALGLSACATMSPNTPTPAPAATEQAATQQPLHDATAVSAPAASATIEGRSGTTTGGTAAFSRSGDKVTLTLRATNLKAGTHAAHLHQNGDCSAPDAASAGGHWNPTSQPHGQWGHDGHHLGDLGNLEVGADGVGTLTLTTDCWTIGGGAPNDIVGKAVVIHLGVDDFTSQPSGNAGGRVGCGVIQAK